MRRGLLALFLLHCGQTVTAQPPTECVRLEIERLDAGQPYSSPLPRGLEFRLVVSRDAGLGWRISVGPTDDAIADYLAPVSPPYQSAPHLTIGAGYGVTAADSVRLTPREFRFVLNSRDMQLAWEIASAARMGDMHRLKDMSKLPQGTLKLRITDSRAADDTVEWIAFAAEACVAVN
jgi:hypothetical protein